jgi:uncharacterized membrane protein
MDFLYILVGGFVLGIILFRRNLLLETESFRIILGVSFLVFLAGLVLHFTEAGRYTMSGALLSPLLSLILFLICRRIFILCFKHEPQDTFLNFEAGKDEDRIFNIIYFTAGFCLVMLAAILMEELAKAGL